MPLTAGTRLGPYEILAAIGAGGMGEVYRARDHKLNRDVAVKVLPDALAVDPDRLARFRREAQVLAALNHPNIGQIYGFEDAGATHALVMELIEGPTLADRIAQGPIPLADALPIATQIAEALQAAHEQGIVHRDLKPANVKVRHDGVVKVLDFGLAKAVGPDGSGSSPDVMNSPTLTARATQLGTILGTAAYMAPEQAKGKAVDKRADIWAFGVVLFEMLAGQRAFKGDDVSDVLAAVLRQDIDWAALPRDTPLRIRRVLERCLERDPKRRLRDIGDVWIGTDAPEEVVPAAASMTARPRSMAAIALPWVAALVIAAGSLSWTLLHAPAAEPRAVRRSLQQLKDLSLFVNLSRDGTRLTYAVAGTGSSAGIALRMLDQFEGKMIAGTEGGVYPVFSPDGQWIVYSGLSDFKIRKIQVTGGTPITLCEGSLQAGAAWGADNTIVFSGGKGLMRVSADGGTPELLTTVDTAKGEAAHNRPQFLPGGRQLLFSVVSAGASQFAVRELDKSGYRMVAKGGLNGQYTLSGHLTYVRGSTLFAVPFDVARLEVIGSEVPIVEGVSTNGPLGTGDYSVSQDGLLAFIANTQGEGTTLAWADRKGVVKPLPGQSQRVWGTGRLSPDGSRVAAGIVDDKGGSDIWVLDVERGTPTRLTFGGGGGDNPIWSPDSRRVMYGAENGKFGLYSVPADASARPTIVLPTESGATPTSFAPDGKVVLFTQTGADKQPRIHVLPLTGDSQPAQTHILHEASSAEADAQISPDGRWVAYTSAESGGAEIYVQPFPGPGGKIRISSNGGSRARWSKDGRELFYWASLPSGTLMAADITTSPAFRAGEPHGLFPFVPGTTWDITADRNRFLVEVTVNPGGSTLAIVSEWFEELRRRAPARK